MGGCNSKDVDKPDSVFAINNMQQRTPKQAGSPKPNGDLTPTGKVSRSPAHGDGSPKNANGLPNSPANKLNPSPKGAGGSFFGSSRSPTAQGAASGSSSEANPGVVGHPHSNHATPHAVPPIVQEQPAPVPVVYNRPKEHWAEVAAASVQLNDFTPDMMHVMVVDDDRPSNQRLADTLAAEQYSVTVCVNGEEAEEVLLSGLEDKAYVDDLDLILCEFTMTTQKKAKFLDFIVNDERTQHIPVILMSGDITIQAAERSIRRGCADFLLKPISKPVLIQTVRTILEVTIDKQNVENLKDKGDNYKQQLKQEQATLPRHRYNLSLSSRSPSVSTGTLMYSPAMRQMTFRAEMTNSHVMLVDRNPRTREKVGDWLAARGIHTTLCDSAQDAFEFLRLLKDCLEPAAGAMKRRASNSMLSSFEVSSTGQLMVPTVIKGDREIIVKELDMVLVEESMPDMTGKQFIAHVLNEYHYQSIPAIYIVDMGGRVTDDPNLPQNLAAITHENYVLKPLSKEVLLKKIQTVLDSIAQKQRSDFYFDRVTRYKSMLENIRSRRSEPSGLMSGAASPALAPVSGATSSSAAAVLSINPPVAVGTGRLGDVQNRLLAADSLASASATTSSAFSGLSSGPPSPNGEASVQQHAIAAGKSNHTSPDGTTRDVSSSSSVPSLTISAASSMSQLQPVLFSIGSPQTRMLRPAKSPVTSPRGPGPAGSGSSSSSGSGSGSVSLVPPRGHIAASPIRPAASRADVRSTPVVEVATEVMSPTERDTFVTDDESRARGGASGRTHAHVSHFAEPHSPHGVSIHDVVGDSFSSGSLTSPLMPANSVLGMDRKPVSSSPFFSSRSSAAGSSPRSSVSLSHTSAISSGASPSISSEPRFSGVEELNTSLPVTPTGSAAKGSPAIGSRSRSHSEEEIISV